MSISPLLKAMIQQRIGY